MTTAIAGTRLSIKTPRKDEVRPGDDLEVVVDLELPDPWFTLPSFGKEISSVDGRSAGGAIAYEANGAIEIVSPLDGTATVRDTKVDVHTPSGFPDVGAGRGVEVAIRQGAVELRFGHLERGSTRSGLVRAGDVIGRAGNTGRCLDGCGRRFVVVEVTGGRTCRTLDDFASPIDVEATLDGKPFGKARFPEGQLKVSQFRVARARAPREVRGAKSLRLEVRVVRNGRPLASEEKDLAVRH